MPVFEQSRPRILLAEAGRRIVAGFSGSRFTWGCAFKWSGIALLAILLTLILILYFLDWNQMRGPIGRYLSHRTGREVRIDGDLRVELFTWQPRIDVNDLYIGNPAWVGTPQAARVKELKLEVRLVPLLFGHLIMPLVDFDRPQVLVVPDANGRSNWDSGESRPGEAARLPPVQRFLVNQGHVEITDHVRKLHFTGTVSSSEERDGKGAAFTLAGDGTLNQSKFLADIHGGPLLNIDESRPYAFSADIHAGDTHVQAKGAVTRPFHLDRFTASLNVTGRDLSDLYYLTGLTLPGTPPYHLTVAVERDGALYRLNDINGVVGNSDLEGSVSVDMSQAIPLLAGKVQSRSLDFDDLGAVVGGGKTAPVQSKFLLPDTVLHTERLRQTNAEVDYSAASIKSRDFPLTGLDTHIGLESGVLTLKPLAFSFTAGKLSGSVRIDARKDIPVSSVDARITDVHIENFIPGGDKPASGVLEAHAQLTATGASAHRAASTAGGNVTVVIPSGGVRHSLAEWLGVDVIDALGLTLSGDQSNTRVRCAVASFAARDGVLSSQQLVFDTDPVRVDGSGRIDLRDETLDMRPQGAPKSFQFLRLHAPITVSGSLAQPKLGVDAKPLIAQGGIGAALGLVFPPAAILAFVDPGLADDANCKPLLADARAKGAPVEASAVKNAAPVRK